jgi:hypothetical protein
VRRFSEVSAAEYVPRAIRREARSATIIVTATCVRKTMISFLVPTMIGANTMTVVAVPAITAVPTSRTPFSVALKGFSLSIARCLKMLSVTTTALSTSMPMASIRPIIDRMFRESPAKYRAPSVIRSENGTDEMTINVVEI